MKKFITLRSEVKPKFSQMSKGLQDLWSEKFQAIQKQKETEEVEEQKTINEVLTSFAEAIIDNSQSSIDNAKKIKELAEQSGIILPEEIEEKPNEKSLEQISKSLSEIGFDGRFMKSRRRVKIH